MAYFLLTAEVAEVAEGLGEEGVIRRFREVGQGCGGGVCDVIQEMMC